jgi:cytochrome c oxidase assembly factor CtaG
MTPFLVPFCAHAPTPGNWASTWELEPGTVLPLALSAWLYAAGVRRIWRRAGPGGGIKRWEACCFAAGWLTLVVALLSPLHPLGSALFAAHMMQHELLMLVAAPLIVLGRPVPAFFAALPRGTARDVARWSRATRLRGAAHVLSNPVAAWLVHGAALWAWHTPALFQATLTSAWLHGLQHTSFFGSALLFWWAAMQGGRAIGYGAATLYMFTTAVHSGLLGAMITLSRSAWYPAYQATAPAWGLSALEDQQIGGAIMWIPAGLVYIIAALALMAGWLRESERRVARWQAHSSAGSV